MEQRKNEEQKELISQSTQYGRAGKITDDIPDIKSTTISEMHLEKEKTKRNSPQFIIVLAILFVLAGIYALYDTIVSSYKLDTNNSVVMNREAVGNKTSQQSLASDMTETVIDEIIPNNEKQQNITSMTDNGQQADIIGKWKDTATDFFYELYKKNGKTFLNFSDIKTISCNLHTLKKNEYKFRNDENGLFSYADGVKVYIGKGFEECYDNNNNEYMSTVILLVQGKRLYVYSNDYDRNVYDELCVALK